MHSPYNINEAIASIFVLIVFAVGYALSIVDRSHMMFLAGPALFIIYGFYLRFKKRLPVVNKKRSYFLLQQGPTLLLSKYFISIPLIVTVVFYAVKFFNETFAGSVIFPLIIVEIVFLMFTTLRIAFTYGEVVTLNNSARY